MRTTEVRTTSDRPRTKRRLVVVALVASCALFVASCGSSDDAQPADTHIEASGRPIHVVASTNVYGSVVSAVGGDRVEVTSLIDNPNADPLEYETTAADAVAVQDAQLVVFNGNGYDPFMPQLLDATGGEPAVVDVVELSGLQMAAGDGQFNEHVFYDMSTVEHLADRIAAVLGATSPEDAAMFTANAQTFKGQIDGLRRLLAEIAAQHAGARIAVTEPLPGYLTAEAGLDNVTPPEFAEAIEEGDDPSAAALADMLALFDGDSADVLILNSQTQSAVTDQVEQAAEDAGVPVVSMSETLTSPDYVTWMNGQIVALAEALDAG